MPRSVIQKTEDSALESVREQDSLWGDVGDAPYVRSPEETEALIARLDRNLATRMANRSGMTDSVKALRRMRAARARYLRRR